MTATRDARRDTTAPITGWARADWALLADRMLAAVRPYASPGHARITPPGDAGGYGSDVDGLEGFARTFLLAGFRLAGEGGADPAGLPGLAEWYAEGLMTGTDPGSAERWPRPDEHGQAKVEAASIALILDLTRPWIWDRLPPGAQERVVDYLATVVGDDDYPRCNWVWFRVVVETFLRSVGGAWSLDDVTADVDAHESFYRSGGWYADGDERSFDHYCGWALHLYPILWSRMRGVADGGDELTRVATARQETDRNRLARFLRDYIRLIGADGSPLIQGRSLTYRFAAAAPLWVGAIAGVGAGTGAVDGNPPATSPSLGQLRRAASGVVAHFAERGSPDERGLLTLGWHHEWRRLAQSYSGPGSPYWAAKGMLGLALPADHPVWTASEERLPAESDDEVWVAEAPGWLVSGTCADGVVRVVNHGTDHHVLGSGAADSPLYARLGYSTATAPSLSAEAWESPVDQAVVLLDARGRATHRTGMRTLLTEVRGDGGARHAVGASTARAHWVDAAPGQRDHGSGRSGVAQDAAAVTTVSVVRGSWEVRCVRVDHLPGDPGAAAVAVRLRVGGWALADDDENPRTDPAEATGGAGTVTAAVWSRRLASLLVADDGFDDAGVYTEEDAGPLGTYSRTPWVSGPVRAGRWVVVGVGLLGRTGNTHDAGSADDAGSAGNAGSAETAVLPEFHVEHVIGRVHVVWPDGVRTETELPASTPEDLPGSTS
ncbi:DUF2264 domain-containing protein [Phytoactinopolyspora alkaliphila]|uniref:DUF2264 domain-containing protein n=1 Tax=Phytoactinopolyspora alkaliphila TaxID=1783498 RepID=A0A6N9YIZ4_9ACTN|nr:DUF2264 domain-containing protein [Phytoactinopolyspora alkaliphila]NED94890.1 DUF2264 domain-containing protein [Phytoactinopolyspora alkaliphila]